MVTNLPVQTNVPIDQTLLLHIQRWCLHLPSQEVVQRNYFLSVLQPRNNINSLNKLDIYSPTYYDTYHCHLYVLKLG